MGGYQYSFIKKSDTSESEKIDFSEYMRLIENALQDIGANAELNGRNDITLCGKKISGNAQYKKSGATVHHGTLLFSTNIEEMVTATIVDPNKIISKSIKSVRERVTNISEHIDGNIMPEEFKSSVIESIMGENFSSYELTQADILGITVIANEFRDWDFVFGKSPKFSIRNTGYFAGGKLTASLNVEVGHISQIEFSGDFFAVDVSALVSSLIGCKYEYDAVYKRLQAQENAIYKISIEEIAKTVMG
ncbi:MAG: lipoate--protein ligase [Clostridiales bacterium]|nr:lipoate--protein ligase [Clostridiales bacterium]